uniref:Uncharacterized protein n=1 Tax=Brassica oleracea var. oleracea TaxID=109376 RepID=A0A0D3AM24_BRAOL
MVDFHEKDWSFLKSMETEQTQKVKKIVKAGEVTESSRVLVSFSSEAFVDRLVESSPSQLLLIVHDSLFICRVSLFSSSFAFWSGRGVQDTVSTLFLRCTSCNQSPARLKQQRKEFSNLVVSDLPDDSTLKSVAKKHSFELTQFVDEQGLYLVVLTFSKQ